MSNLRHRRRARAGLLIVLGLLVGSAQASEPTTRALGGPERDRGGAERRSHEQLEDYVPGQAKRPQRKLRRDGVRKAAPCCAFRIYAADTRLFDDYDGDGYYTYLRVTFDVDTDYAVADVYADVYLVDSAGVFSRIFESDLFTIYGSSPGDDYEIEAELVAGFPPDDYDVLIEIYDAYDDRLVVEYGAYESSALSLLPLEDISYDTLTPVVHAHGGGGAPSIPALLLLGLLATVLRRSRT